MILAAVQATFWPIRVFGVCLLCLFVLTRFTCGNRRKIPCVLVLTCAVAVATEWLISHHCLLRPEDLFLASEMHVVFWMDWISCLGRCSSRGLSTGLYLFRYWSNSISGGGFIRRFLARWGFALPAYRFAFSDSSEVDGLRMISNLMPEY